MRSIVLVALLAGVSAQDETVLLQNSVQTSSPETEVNTEDVEYEKLLRSSDLKEEEISALLAERKRKEMTTWKGDNGMAPNMLGEVQACAAYECPKSFATHPEAQATICKAGVSCVKQCCVEVPDFFRYEGFYLPEGNELVGTKLHAPSVHGIEEVDGSAEQMQDYMADKFQLLTLSEAKAKCTSSAACTGFCHENAPADALDRLYITFKSSGKMYPSLPSDSAWTTYLMKEADAKTVHSLIKTTPVENREAKHARVPDAIRNSMPKDMKTMELEAFAAYEEARTSGSKAKLEAAEDVLRAQGHQVPSRDGLKFPKEERAEKIRKFQQNVQKAWFNQWTRPMAPLAVLSPNAAEEGAPTASADRDLHEASSGRAVPGDKPQFKFKTGQMKALKQQNAQLEQSQVQLSDMVAKLQNQLDNMLGVPAPEERNLAETSAHRAEQVEEVAEEVDEDQWQD